MDRALEPRPAHANLLVNGSFEDGGGIQFGQSFYAVLAAGSTELPGWVVNRDTVDYQSDVRNPIGDDLCLGDCCIDLDGTPGFGAIAQTFATVAGQLYSVSFALTGNAGEFDPSEPDVKLLRVLVAATSVDMSFDTAGYSSGNPPPWITKTVTFTAVDTTTTLEFQSLDTAAGGYSGYFGPTIDNVAVNVVPEPSTALLVMAGVLFGCRARRLGLGSPTTQPR